MPASASATDIDEHALGVTRAARYPEQRLDGVSAERRRRFFVQDGARLAVVQSIARQTLGTGPAVDTYTQRLKALGRVQGLFGRSDGAAIDLGELVRLELRTHGGDEDERVSLEGLPVALGLDHMQTLALALHELATNAVKHGALAQGAARLSIAWATEADPRGGVLLVLTWTESGVAMPSGAEGARGFGRELIEKALRYSLQAQARFVLGPDGVLCRIAMPL